MIAIIYMMLLTLMITFLYILKGYRAIPCIAKKDDKDIITHIFVRKKYAKYVIENKRNLADIEVDY